MINRIKTNIVDFVRDLYFGILKINHIIKEEEENMSNKEVKELRDRIKAMTPEELAIVADNIPVELCITRIRDELNRAKALEESIQLMAGTLRKE